METLTGKPAGMTSRASITDKAIAIERGRYTSGRIAVANLSASIAFLERRRSDGTRFEDLVRLSELLFVRGGLLGLIADHDEAECVAAEAMVASHDAASALYIRARLARRFHRFDEAGVLLDRALAAGHPAHEIDAGGAAILQATGRYDEALSLRERLAKEDPAIHTLGALASLLAEMDQWTRAQSTYEDALDTYWGVSPILCGQLLFEWGASAARRGNLERAEMLFGELEAILPEHVPGRGHRAEVALARGRRDLALVLVTPLLDTSDDPGYRALHAQILAARGEREAAATQAQYAAAAYEKLLAQRPEAYAEQAAAFFLASGNRPQRALELAALDVKLSHGPRTRNLLATGQCSLGEVA